MIELCREELLFICCCTALFYAVCLFPKMGKYRRPDWKNAAFCIGKTVLTSFFVIAGTELLYHLFQARGTLYQMGKPLCLIIVAAISILFLPRGGILREETGLLRGMAGCALAACFIEVFLMNCGIFAVQESDSFTPVLGDAKVWGNVVYDSNEQALIIGAGGGGFELKGLPGIRMTGLELESNSSAACRGHISFWIQDEHFQSDYYECGSYPFVSGSEFSRNFLIRSSGALGSLKIQVDSNRIPITITGLRINEYIPAIYMGRAGGIFLLLCLFLYVKYQLGLRRKEAVRGPENRAVLTMMFLFCAFIVTALYQLPLDKQTIAYPLTDPVEEYDIYVQQFDAWMKGQLHLDILPDAYLEKVENPYDKTERTYVDSHEEFQHYYTGIDTQLPYWWDHVYFEGKFYCYFGPAVLFTFYYPFYLLTGVLPSNFLVTTFFAMGICVMLALLYRQLMHMLFKRVYTLLYGLGYLAAAALSTVFTLQVCIDTYNIAMITGLFYLISFLAVFLMAIGQRRWKKRILYVISGILFGLIALSRPGLMVYAGIPIPLWYMQQKKEKNSKEALNLLFFALPVIFFALFTMGYNYLRFGNILEFGIAYQMTVYNVMYCRFELTDVFPAIYYYFLQMPVVNTSFPYFHMSRYAMPSYNSFCALENNVGAFTYPCTWILAGAGKAFRSRKINGYVRMTYFLMLILPLFLAVFDFSFSGVTFRYSGDIMLILALLSVCLLMELVNLSEKTVLEGVIQKGAAGALLVSVFISLAFVMENERGQIGTYFPELLNALERTFMFWV